MKKTLLLASTALITSAYAQDILLNSNDIVIDSNEAVIVRTSLSPHKVKITMKIPVTKQICERYETRYSNSSINCGYGPGFGYGYGGYGGFGGYGRYGGGYYGGGMYGLCQQQQTYCAEFKTITDNEFDSVKIKFKNLPELGGSETDTFKIKARQKKFDSSNMLYSLEAVKTLQPYSIQDKGFLGSDRFVIEAAE